MYDELLTTYDTGEMMIISQKKILRPYTTWLFPPDTSSVQINYFRLREGKCHEHTPTRFSGKTLEMMEHFFWLRATNTPVADFA